MKFSIKPGFTSLKRTLNLSPNENICTIALITIHYLYNIEYDLTRKVVVDQPLQFPALTQRFCATTTHRIHNTFEFEIFCMRSINLKSCYSHYIVIRALVALEKIDIYFVYYLQNLLQGL